MVFYCQRKEQKYAENDISLCYYGRNAAPEYCYTNYDPEQVKKDFEIISASLMEMQMALDNYNQTEQFDVDI